MDRMGADFERGISMMRERLGANPVAIQLPIGSEDSFSGIIDLVRMKANIYHDADGRTFEVCDIPAEYQEKAEEYRQLMLEAAAEFDDDLMEAYLEGEEIKEEQIIHALRVGTLKAALNPVLCGSSFKNKGPPASCVRTWSALWATAWSSTRIIWTARSISCASRALRSPRRT